MRSPHQRLGRGARRGRAVSRRSVRRAHLRRAGRAHRRGGAALRPGADLADHARARHRAQHPRRQQRASPASTWRWRAARSGKPGGGTMTLTGQGNGQGGREVGQKANQLPGYRHIDVPGGPRSTSPTSGASPRRSCPRRAPPPPRWSSLMADGRDQELPGHLLQPDGLAARQRRRRSARCDTLDPLVVIDFFLSETAELADVVLPGTVWCEDEGTTTNLEGRVIKINKAVDPPGEARAATGRSSCDLARRLGTGPVLPLHVARARSGTSCASPRRAASPTTTASPGRRSTRRTASSGPAPREDHPGTPRLFTERFGHPDGKARCSPIALRAARRGAGRATIPFAPDDRPRGLPLPQRQPDAPPRLPERAGARAVGRDPPARRPSGWASRDDDCARAHAARRDGAARRWSCRPSGPTRSSSRSTTATGRR